MGFNKCLIFLSLLFLISCSCWGTVDATELNDVVVNDVGNNYIEYASVDVDDIGYGGDSPRNLSILHNSENNQSDNLLEKSSIGNPTGSFKELKQNIDDSIKNNWNIITLNKNYKYEIGDNLEDGIFINHTNLVINGNGHTIDCDGLARAFKITGNNITLLGINFINSFATESGGAIKWYNCGNCCVVGCNFVNSSSNLSGGAIDWYNCGNCCVVGCNFVNSSAKQSGGAIDWYDGVNSCLINCRFINSISDYESGAVYLLGDNSSVVNCSFIYSAASYGGAVYLLGDNSSVVNCSFIYSVANYGGAVYVLGDYVSVVNSSFLNSVAKKGGGTIFWYSSKNHPGYNNSVINSTFVNSISNYGGAIEWYYGDDCVVSYCSFVNSSANYGGAIYGYYSESGVVSYCSFVNSSANFTNVIDGEGCILKQINCRNTSLLLRTEISVNNISVDECNNIVINANIVDEENKSINEGCIYLINDNKLIFSNITNGKVNFNLNLTPYDIKNNSFNIIYEGIRNYYAPSNVSCLINITPKATFINPTTSTIYNGKYFKVILKDSGANALINKTVKIKLLSKIYTVTTDNNGVAKIRVSVSNKYIGKSLKVFYKFEGDCSYCASNGSVSIRVSKMNTKISRVTYGNLKNHAYFRVKLTTKNGNVLSNKIITMKSVNSGKVYKIKTNSKGIGKIDLWVKCKPLSRYYKYIFKYSGSKYYKSYSIKFKVKIV
ncbi:MAG: hypothetical protein MJ232_03730 [archaeon]|nr:hypothetical protein [archaeon]